jgi:hypothetical protein
MAAALECDLFYQGLATSTEGVQTHKHTFLFPVGSCIRTVVGGGYGTVDTRAGMFGYQATCTSFWRHVIKSHDAIRLWPCVPSEHHHACCIVTAVFLRLNRDWWVPFESLWVSVYSDRNLKAYNHLLFKEINLFSANVFLNNSPMNDWILIAAMLNTAVKRIELVRDRVYKMLGDPLGWHCPDVWERLH